MIKRLGITLVAGGLVGVCSPGIVQAQLCDVVFGISESTFLTTYLLSVSDSPGPGAFVATFAEVDCEVPNPSISGGAVDIAQTGKELSVTLSAMTPIITGGVDLLRCTYDAGGGPLPQAGQFTLLALAALNGSLPVLPPPAGEIRRIECGNVTTTTNPFATTTTTVSTATTTTTLDGGAGTCDVTFTLDEAVTLSVYMVEFSYPNSAGGDFIFSTAPGTDMLGGVCTIGAGTNVAPVNFDTDNAPLLNLFRVNGGAMPPGATGPIDLATCKFRLNAPGPGPMPSDFTANVIEVRDLTFQPVSPPPSFSVSAVECQVGATTTTLPFAGCACGDPVLPPGSGAFTTRAVNATDALFALNAGVGSQSCELCVCDVNDSGAVNATDALIILQAAVGQSVSLTCPLPL